VKFNGFVSGLVIGVLIVSVYATARAYITKQKTLGASVVRAGDLNLTISPENGLFDFSGLVPGESTGEKKIKVENTGDMDLKYRISAVPVATSDNNELLKKLRVKVKEYGESGNLLVTHYASSTKYLSDLTNSTIDEEVPKGKWREIGIELSLSTTAGAEVAGLTTNFNFIVEAVQANGSF